jgi:glycosyltransferase involved in cell wall biosynthesis
MTVPSVCFVSPYAHALFSGDPVGFGGAEVQQGFIARALVARGIDVRFVSYAAGPPRKETRDGIRFHTIPPPGTSEGPRSPGSAHLAFWRAMARADAEVYYQRCAGTLTGLVGLFARLHRRSFLFAVANDQDLDGQHTRSAGPFRALFYRLGVRLAAAVVIQSDLQAKLLREHWGREGVLIESACPLPALPPPGASDRKGVIWVGSLFPRKRPALVTELARALPDVSFTLIAPRKGKPDFMKSVIADLFALPNVCLLDGVPYSEMSSHYRRAAMLVSTSAAEGFPNTFLEAWAHRLPVVSLEIDPDEILCKRGLGRHVKTLAEAAAAIRGLLDDVSARDAIGLQAEAYVRERHVPEAVAASYERLLRLIAARGSRYFVGATR